MESKHIYAKFYSLARQYVGVVTNSVLVESLFSKAENAITENKKKIGLHS